MWKFRIFYQIMTQKSKRGCNKTKEDGVAIRKDAANQGVATLSAQSLKPSPSFVFRPGISFAPSPRFKVRVVGGWVEIIKQSYSAFPMPPPRKRHLIYSPIIIGNCFSDLICNTTRS